MTISELFIKIGLKGDAAVVRGLKGAENAVKGVTEASIGAKAALIGVIYGLERLTGFAGKAGMELTRFETIVGDPQALQNWQYALNKFNVSGDEVMGTVTRLKKAMIDMRMGKGAPEGLGILSHLVGNLDINQAEQDWHYFMSKIQEGLKKANQTEFLTIQGGLGLSDSFAYAMKAAPDINKISGAGISQGDIKTLNSLNQAWQDIWYTLEKLGKQTVANHGLGPVKDLKEAILFIRDSVKWIDKMTASFYRLQDGLKLAGVAMLFFSGPLGVASAAIIAIVKGFAEIQKYREGKEGLGKDLEQKLSDFKNGLFSIGDNHSFVGPPNPTQGSSGTVINNNFSQTNTIHGVYGDVHEISKEIGKQTENIHKKAAQSIRTSKH